MTPSSIGKYRLIRQLGRGGMGVVYLAVQPGLEREVALKVLPPAFIADTPSVLKRFMREAAICSQLSHPGIVRVYDYGCEEGSYYYAMEVLRATSLDDKLRDLPVPPLEFTLRIAREVAEAMAYYLARDILHRDIKPSNIMLDESGRAILTDFGLVKDPRATQITRAGVALGTPYYMAPEMVRGHSGPASDIWQFGVVFYRMLCGQLPFQGETAGEVFKKILYQEPIRPGELNTALPRSVETVALNCLEKDPGVRYGDAEQLLADLRAAGRRASVASRRMTAAAESAPSVPRPGSSARLPAAKTMAPAMPDPGNLTTVPMDIGTNSGAIRMLAVRLGPPAVLVAALVLWFLRAQALEPLPPIRADLGIGRALVSWESATRYAGAVEWGDDSGGALSMAREPYATSSHRIWIEPLKPGASYSFQVLGTGGARSLPHGLRSPENPAQPLSLRRGPDFVSLEFSTPSSCSARLSSSETAAADSAPTARHRLRLSPFHATPASLELGFELPTGECVLLRGEPLAELLRRTLLEPLARETVSKLESFDPHTLLTRVVDRNVPAYVCAGATRGFEEVGFGGMLLGVEQGNALPHYEPFSPADGAGPRLAADLEKEIRKGEFLPPFETLLWLAPDVLDRRRLPAEAARRLHAGLRRLRQVARYCELVALPYSSGVETLYTTDGRLRRQPWLPEPTAFVTLPLPADEGFVYPPNEARVLFGSGWNSASRKPIKTKQWTFDLPRATSWRQAELALLDTKMESELCFEATLNTGYTVDFHTAAAGVKPSERRVVPYLGMTIDPRHLLPGRNTLRVEVRSTPGTRYLGLKRHNCFSAVKLAWN